MKLESKVAIVTGAGTGIGRAIAILFAKEGVQVVVANRTMAQYDIRVNCLVPGAINTPMMWQGLNEAEKAKLWQEIEETTPLGRIGYPEEMAKAALFLACEDSSYVTGAAMIVDGGELAKLAAVI